MTEIDNSFDDEDLFIADILSKVKTIAMVGVSKNWKRPSNFVMKYLQKHGYKVIPVNPGTAGQLILNELCYASLAEIPIKIDMVDIFRHSDFCADVTRDGNVRNLCSRGRKQRNGNRRHLRRRQCLYNRFVQLQVQLSFNCEMSCQPSRFLPLPMP